MRKRMAMSLSILAIALFATSACGGSPSAEVQRVDFGVDAMHMGFAPVLSVDNPVIEASTNDAKKKSKKKKSKYNSGTKKWEQVSDPKVTELELTLESFAGCRVELDRVLDETDSETIGGRTIEMYRAEIETKNYELEVDVLGAHTPQQVLKLFANALPTAPEKIDCFTGRL